MDDSKVSFKDYLEKEGTLIYTNVGTSMLPLIRQKKDILVISKKERKPKRLDAVLFIRDNGSYVVHRILKDKGDTYYIAGDNCSNGEYVREDQIIGILTKIKRGNREIGENDFWYRVYAHLWSDIYPIRYALVWIYGMIKAGIDKYIAKD